VDVHADSEQEEGQECVQNYSNDCGASTQDRQTEEEGLQFDLEK